MYMSKQLKGVQTLDMNGRDRKYAGAPVRVKITAPETCECSHFYVREYDGRNLKRTRYLGCLTPQSTLYVWLHVGDVLVEKRMTKGIAEWYPRALGIHDDEDQFEFPRLARAWDQEKVRPCECHGMEALCEECGGSGWIPAGKGGEEEC